MTQTIPSFTNNLISKPTITEIHGNSITLIRIYITFCRMGFGFPFLFIYI